MSLAIVLYGSRARGDAREDSDVDVLVAAKTGKLLSPRKFDGLSVHFYPQDWMISRAAEGDLFACHIAFEGVSVFEAQSFLDEMRHSFQRKRSYQKERDIAVAVLSLTARSDWTFNDEIRRRFFWSIRTLALTILAERKEADFSLAGLDRALGRQDVADLFRNREGVTFEICKQIANEILQDHDTYEGISTSSLVRFLIKQGGIGLNTAKLVEMDEAINVGSLPTYI
ncbi:hypothetical protein GCM10023208_12020 [Erythrobacter westpacificensis]|uniref:Polymerase nucleotidyl transferase domain-containing protein n=1 Tax=Erythrobacter westpacificensis TaxID=1055231 RepID=A0ABP9K7R0_9SPHN